MSERIVNDPSLHGWVEEDGKWVWDGTDSGAGMIISETEPDAVDGTQWLNALTGEVFIYDDGKWLEFPGGKDGAAGADGNIADGSTDGIVATWDSTAGQWTPDPSLTINAAGNATFSGKATFGQPNAESILNERIHIVGSDGPVLPSDYAGGGAVAQKDYLVVENNGNSNIALVGNAGGFPSMKFNVYDPNNLSYSYNGLIGYKDSTKTLEFCLIDYQYDGDAGETPVAVMLLKHSGDPSLGKSSQLEVLGDIVATNRLFKSGNVEVTGVDDLVRVLSTLRQATMDETQDIRESLRSAIDELVEGFEQEISTMEESE